MNNLKDLYENNINIMKYFRKNNKINENDSDAILVSYDLQAGTYRSSYYSSHTVSSFYKNAKVELTDKDFYNIKYEYVSNLLKDFQFNSILEAGTGEATSLVTLFKFLKKYNNEIKGYGFDISLSRIKVAKEFCLEQNISSSFFCADMNHIPLLDNSVDVVFTNHAIEPNTNKAFEIVMELFRVCSKYLILIEPSYELGNEETKKNIEEHCYIKNLKEVIQTLDGKIIHHELMPISTYSNLSEIFIIEKNSSIASNEIDYVCPICKTKLILHKGNYFCNNCLLVYPVLDNIVDLNPSHSIIFSHYLD